VTDPITTTIRTPVTVSPAPENEYSRSLVICRSSNYWPSIIERLVGGAYDPLVFPMSFGSIFNSDSHRELIWGAMDIGTAGFMLHKPREILLITDEEDVAHIKAAVAVAKRMSVEVQRLSGINYEPSFRHIHIDENRNARIEAESVSFPRRKTKHLVLGCIDPRLLRVRTDAERNDLSEAAWFTVPGCIKHLGSLNMKEWKNLPLWITENLRYAIKELGMSRLTVCPHEGCKAHPVANEYSRGVQSRQKALRKRINETKKEIRRLRKTPLFGKLDIDVMAVTLGGQRMATRVVKKGRKTVEIILS
jgi:carbonic anhydrase